MIINRDNWRQHCDEPELTGEELHELREMRTALHDSEELRNRIIADLAAVYDAADATKRNDQTWAGLVHDTDIRRRVTRQELAWWRLL